MSNIIPIVSSSPPPLEDGHSFGWDEEEDDFGSFASAPVAADTDSRVRGASHLDVDWSQTKSVSTASLGDDGDVSKSANEVENGDQESWSSHQSSPVKGFSNGDEVGFADFAWFQESSVSKPQISCLPLKEEESHVLLSKINMQAGEASKEGGHEELSHAEAQMGRESMTDSGMFSSDISPVARSDNTYDKASPSEDETFPDLPQDGHTDDAAKSKESSDTESQAYNHQAGLCVSCDNGSETQSASFVDLHENISSKTSLTDTVKHPDTCSRNTSALEHELDHSSDTNVDIVPKASAVESKTESVHLYLSSGEANHPHVCFDQAPSDDVFVTQLAVVDCTNEEESGTESDRDISTASVENPQENAAHGAIQSSRMNPLEEGQEFPYTLSIEADQAQGIAKESDKFEAQASADPLQVSHIASPQDGSEEHWAAFEQTEDAAFPESGSQNSSSDPDASSEPEDLDFRTGIANDLQAGNDLDEFGTFDQYAGTDPANKISEDELSGESSLSLQETQFDEPKSNGESQSGNQHNMQDSGIASEAYDKAASQQNSDDDFGDFSCQPKVELDDACLELRKGCDEWNVNQVSSDPTSDSASDDFGDFSSKAANDIKEEDSFGDFSSQTTNDVGSSGWADFAEPVKAVDIGSENNVDLADQFPLTEHWASSVPEDKANKQEKALMSCFPLSKTKVSIDKAPAANGEKENIVDSMDSDDVVGKLDLIVKYGLAFRVCSKQTWQVVEHPSKKDPGVRLWGNLKDVDVTHAVSYQWQVSAGNKRLFSTLHIDTQNMLIGHRKPAVPVYATGLSLLEPIRGGGERDHPPKVIASHLVDPNLPDTDKLSQDIPAVDFDWSTSGLTNPLTSKSLDLDFLVVQERDSSGKNTVFESEILDAPRSNAKTLQPLQDILKNAKSTSVPYRRDDVSAEMSPEAARIVSSLPDLRFMLSKVLMFPIKN